MGPGTWYTAPRAGERHVVSRTCGRRRLLEAVPPVGRPASSVGDGDDLAAPTDGGDVDEVWEASYDEAPGLEALELSATRLAGLGVLRGERDDRLDLIEEFETESRTLFLVVRDGLVEFEGRGLVDR